MHKLIEFICDELEDLERKTDKGKLTMQDLQYADTLAHLKKNLLKAEEMSEGESSRGSSRDGGSSREGSGRSSYRRGRDSMGRYTSRDGSYRSSYDDGMEELEEQLREMEQNAPNEDAKRMIKEWMRQLK